MTIQSPITTEKETNILQSFSDATAGRSLQLYYAMASTSTAGTSFILSRDAGTSDPDKQVYDDNPDVNYDITINKPTIVGGLATIDLTLTNASAGGGAVTTAACTIYHYDGSTETSLGTATASYTSDVTSSQTRKLIITVSKKLFKIGDTLRLNIILTQSNCTSEVQLNPFVAGNECKLWLPIVNLE